MACPHPKKSHYYSRANRRFKCDFTISDLPIGNNGGLLICDCHESGKKCGPRKARRKK